MCEHLLVYYMSVELIFTPVVSPPMTELLDIAGLASLGSPPFPVSLKCHR